MTSPAATLLADAITTPHLHYTALLPMLIVWGGAVLGVLVEAFAPHRVRWSVQVPLSFVAIIASLVAVISLHGTTQTTASGAVVIDGVSLFLQGTILVLSLISLAMMAERTLDRAGGGGAFVGQASVLPGSAEEREISAAGRLQSEIFPLFLFSLGGMMLFPATNNLLTMFVALEVFSLPLYLLCGLARRRRLLSQEAAVKYFLLGAFSSAFFLYGLAMVYGFANSVDLGVIGAAARITSHDQLLFIGVAMLSIGLLFKVSAAPFQNWTPDVYQGAPTPITGFMAACTKVAAFGALLRVYYVAFGPLTWDWRPIMWGVAILTMIVGAVLGLTQTDVKRMLAYSSIAHAGFLLTGVLAFNSRGVSSVMFYLVTYGFATIGAFAIVTLVRDANGEATHLSQWRGLARRSPVTAAALTFLLLAMAGIPLTSGFVGKFAVFQAAIDGGAVPVVIIAVVMSAVAAFFYIRLVVLMYWQEPAADGPTVAVPSIMTFGAIALTVAVTLVLGIIPGPLLDLANHASTLLAR